MIRKKDVIRMKVPYPSIINGMALHSHMYICYEQNESKYKYIKCQTLKPYMLTNNPITHYHDEEPDINRNPFVCITRIDCDKLFSTENAVYNDKLKTTIRPDICEDLFLKIEKELLSDGFLNIDVNETELKSINCLIR